MTGVEEAAALRELTERMIVAAVDAQAIGFFEVSVAARLAAEVRNGGSLTLEQARQAWRILSRNEVALHAAGLRVPAPSAVSTPPLAPVPPAGDVGRPQLALREDGRIGVINHPFALKEALKTEAHASFDRARKQWHTAATPACAAALATVLGPHDPMLSPRVAALLEEYHAREQRRAVLHPDAPLPDIDLEPELLRHADLWEHQIRAVDYGVSESAFLPAITMGGGKTAIGIAIANRTAAQRVLIVCPNKVRGVWPREIGKWTRRPWHIVDGKRPPRRKGGRMQDLPMAERLAQAEACLFDCACGARVHAAVFNYEMLAHEPVRSWVPPVQLDLVIYDEAHRLKSPTGQVSRRAGEWVDFFRRRLGLTGTPMPQFEWDIFGLYRALDPGILGTRWTPFKTEYVQTAMRKDDGKEFPVAIKKEKRREFAIKVHSIMYRPTIDLKLPGATHIIRRVELEPPARREYQRLEQENFADLAAFARLADSDPIDDAPLLIPPNVLARRIRMRQLTGGTLPDDGEVQPDGKVARTKYRVSTAKVDDLDEILDEIGCVAGRPGGPEPVCVYAAFLDDLTMVRELTERLGLRYREISGRRGDGLTDQSEMAPDADVCGVQIDSGGTGVDLTRSCYGVWYSADYKVGPHDQALKRQDRPGQTRPVRFIHLVATGTIDEEVYRSMASRRSAVATFLATRGISPRLAGLSDEDAAPEWTLDEIERKFNTDRTAEGAFVEGGGAAARLPIDEYATDIFDAPPAQRFARRKSVSDAQLREYDLDGLV